MEGRRSYAATKDAQTKFRKEGNALGMVQRWKYVASRGVQIRLRKEENVLGTVQKSKDSYVAMKVAQIML